MSLVSLVVFRLKYFGLAAVSLFFSFLSAVLGFLFFFSSQRAVSEVCMMLNNNKNSTG